MQVFIFDIITNIMSSIIPVDLLSYATDPSYLSSIVTTNASNPDIINLLAYDESFASVIGESATGRLLESLDWDAFHEAGVYNKDTNKLYVTSSWAGDLNNPINVTVIDLADNYSINSTRIPGVAEANGATSYYPPGTQTNGSTPSRVLYCDQGDFVNPAGLVSVDPVTGESELILSNFLGRNFTSPNDVRQHPVTGDLWFTDPDYAYVQGFRPEPSLPKQVYRFSPSTGQIAVVADDFVEPNGLEFSPDYKTLYVSDTGAAGYSLNVTRPATLYAFDITHDAKRLTGRRTFAYSDNGIPDGLHTDTEGNVWAGCGDGIHIWNPEGTLIGKIWVGITTANFAFLPGAVMVFSNKQLWIVENIKAMGREVAKDFGLSTHY